MTHDAQTKYSKKDVIRRSKRLEELAKKKNSTSDNDDNISITSSDDENEEMDVHEYRKFLKKIFPSKHLNKKIASGERLKASSKVVDEDESEENAKILKNKHKSSKKIVSKKDKKSSKKPVVESEDDEDDEDDDEDDKEDESIDYTKCPMVKLKQFLKKRNLKGTNSRETAEKRLIADDQKKNDQKKTLVDNESLSQTPEDPVLRDLLQTWLDSNRSTIVALREVCLYIYMLMNQDKIFLKDDKKTTRVSKYPSYFY